MTTQRLFPLARHLGSARYHHNLVPAQRGWSSCCKTGRRSLDVCSALRVSLIHKFYFLYLPCFCFFKQKFVVGLQINFFNTVDFYQNRIGRENVDSETITSTSVHTKHKTAHTELFLRTKTSAPHRSPMAQFHYVFSIRENIKIDMGV